MGLSSTSGSPAYLCHDARTPANMATMDSYLKPNVPRQLVSAQLSSSGLQCLDPFIFPQASGESFLTCSAHLDRHPVRMRPDKLLSHWPPVLVLLAGFRASLPCAAPRGYQFHQRGDPAVSGPAGPGGRWLPSGEDDGIYLSSLLSSLKRRRKTVTAKHSVTSLLCVNIWLDSSNVRACHCAACSRLVASC